MSEVENKHVLVVEDIYDTGASMTKMLSTLKKMGAATVKSAIAFHKLNPDNVSLNYRAEYVGFEVPMAFIVGYGCDYNEKFREVPHLFVLNETGIKEFAQ